MDFSKIPKQFCENVEIGVTPEFFALKVSSGEESKAYVLTLQHAKRLSQSLSYNVAEFEKKYGEINAQWTPGIQSPIQMDTLKGGEDESKKKKGK